MVDQEEQVENKDEEDKELDNVIVVAEIDEGEVSEPATTNAPPSAILSIIQPHIQNSFKHLLCFPLRGYNWTVGFEEQ